MLALEDYTEWDTSGLDFESYVDESLFSTGNRFHLFFGQSSVSISVHVGSGGTSGTGSTSGTGTEPGGEAASGTLDLPKPEEAEAVPVTEPVDARSVYILSGGAVSTGENGTTAGEGMQDGSVQLVLPEKAAQKTWPVYAALALSVLPFEARAAAMCSTPSTPAALTSLTRRSI